MLTWEEIFFIHSATLEFYRHLAESTPRKHSDCWFGFDTGGEG